MDSESVASIFLPPGHNAGDLVESYKWEILKEAPGKLEVKAHLPDRLLNPRDQLFGGFHGVYVDLMSICTAYELCAVMPNLLNGLVQLICE